MNRKLFQSLVLLAGISAGAVAAELPRWEFDNPADAKAWAANGHLAEVVCTGGILSARAIDWDPYFHCRDLAIKAEPWQMVVIRIKASAPGIAELFWSGKTEGQYGGLTQDKTVRFSVRGGDWQEIALFPFWHTEGMIRQLRLDVYNGAKFEIDWIRVLDWGKGQTPSAVCPPETGDLEAMRIYPGIPERFTPPLRIDMADQGWVTLELSSDTAGKADLLWAGESIAGLQTESFDLFGDGKTHSYNLQMEGVPGWKGRIVALGLRLPEKGNLKLAAFRLGREPAGPGEIAIRYFGYSDAVDRAERSCGLLLQVVNRGGAVQGIRSVDLQVPAGLSVVAPPPLLSNSGLEHNQVADFLWQIRADKAGAYPVTVSFSGKGILPEPKTAVLSFSSSMPVSKVDYIPAPRPVKTSVDVLAYYFPGWDSDGKWDCIRNTAPIRKPLLGYYDESNPECVDWQIKWAVENGIGGFLVDWYWVQGNQQLTHWFEAYRKARYRDSLKVAIMWANHNPPNTHSPADWLAVTRYWIDRYFTLPGYYRIGDKPAVFLWNLPGLRNDLGGTTAVKAALEQSQELARAAGFAGIAFVAMNDLSSGNIAAAKDEGFVGITTYHEWGRTIDGRPGARNSYESVVAESPAAWLDKDKAAGSLTYYPVVDTGWDSRPWHGDKSMVIEGRTPERFEKLLQSARTFARDNKKPIVILGPVNEWGEGSYIEPCTEFGFAMLEAVRRVFAEGPASSWPQNLAPGDIGRGPYDYPKLPRISEWSFDKDADGWKPLMGIGDVACKDGALNFRTTSPDPALIVSLRDILAAEFRTAEIRIRLSSDAPVSPPSTGLQLFWSQNAAAISETSSVRTIVPIDGQWHTVRLDLAANPRWKGKITSLRLDPGDQANLSVAIDVFSLR